MPVWLRTALVVICGLVAAYGLGGGAWSLATDGVGRMGVSNGIPWGWDIVLFVYWIGLGHAGTLISSVLLLTGQHWRREIARHAELMTLCAVVTAGIFPLIHVGRILMIWQLNPLPVSSGVWPNLSSALVWDAAAISTYLLLSFLFLLTELRTDSLPTGAPRARNKRICLLMAAVLTPLVVTVHSVVGCDFAVTLRWHSVLIPPYFVCGAILSGLALVGLISLCMKASEIVRDKLGKLTAGVAGAMGLMYALELAEAPELWSGHYGAMLLLNAGIPLLLLVPQVRLNRWAQTAVCLCILTGMWLERCDIIIGRSAAQTGAEFAPTATDLWLAAGSLGLFLSLFLSTAHRIPAEPACEEAENNTHSTAPRALAVMFGGAAIGLLTACGWAALTQGADTAGDLTGRPDGPAFIWPALWTATLAGAGLALFFYSRVSRQEK